MNPNVKYGWLVELGPGPMYLMVCRENKRFKWTSSAAMALRFAREIDAKEVAEMVDATRIAEHAWDDYDMLHPVKS